MAISTGSHGLHHGLLSSATPWLLLQRGGGLEAFEPEFQSILQKGTPTRREQAEGTESEGVADKAFANHSFER